MVFRGLGCENNHKKKSKKTTTKERKPTHRVRHFVQEASEFLIEELRIHVDELGARAFVLGVGVPCTVGHPHRVPVMHARVVKG